MTSAWDPKLWSGYPATTLQAPKCRPLLQEVLQTPEIRISPRKKTMNVSLMSPEVMETWLCGCKQLGSHSLVPLTVLKLGGWLAKSFPVWTSQSPLTGICLVELWCLCRDLSQSIAWKKQMCGQIQSDTGTGSCKPFSTKTSHHKLIAGKCTHLTFEWIPACMQHRLDTEDWRCSK